VDIVHEYALPHINFTIPFEMNIPSTLTAVTPNQSVMDNGRTEKLFELVEDPGTHPLGKIADKTLVQNSDLSRPVRCFRMYWTCVSNLQSDSPASAIKGGCDIAISRWADLASSAIFLVLWHTRLLGPN